MYMYCWLVGGLTQHAQTKWDWYGIIWHVDGIEQFAAIDQKHAITAGDTGEVCCSHYVHSMVSTDMWRSTRSASRNNLTATERTPKRIRRC